MFKSKAPALFLALAIAHGSQLPASPDSPASSASPSEISNLKSEIAGFPALSPLLPDSLSAEWQKILSAIKGHQAIEAHFEEKRHFPFRREPVTLHGIMRWHKDLGLSLDYPEQAETLVVSTTGIRRRQNQESFRNLPDDPRLRAQLDLFLPLLSFDFKTLATSCDLSGHLNNKEEWTLKLIPKTTAIAPAFLDLTTTGESDKLKTITIRRDERVRIEITFQRTVFLDLGFTTAEKKQHWGTP